MPTFVNLQSPEKIYFRKEKAIGLSDSYGGLEQSENSRFAYTTHKLGLKRGIVVYDFDSGKSVRIQQSYKGYKGHKSKIWPGHVNGKFCALYMDPYTEIAYVSERRKVDKERKNVQWELDQRK